MTTDAIKLDALRQEVEAARKRLKAAKASGKRDHVLMLSGYIGGLQVAIDVCVKGSYKKPEALPFTPENGDC